MKETYFHTHYDQIFRDPCICPECRNDEESTCQHDCGECLGCVESEEIRKDEEFEENYLKGNK